MRQLGQLALVIAAISSGALCFITGALWVASYRSTLAIEATSIRAVGTNESHRRFLTFLADRGGLQAQYGVEIWSVMKPAASTDWRFEYQTSASPKYPQPWFAGATPRFGFYFNWFENRATIDHEIIIPCWSILAVTMILPAMWLRGALRRQTKNRRRLAGLCAVCGYNLRGNVSGVCPECGAAK